MTATSPPKRRFKRLFSMESLGFIDGPSAIWTTSPPSPITEPSVASGTLQTTGLVAAPVGKHTRRIEPTGELVKDIWDSTELHAPSLIDWAPQTFNTSKLGRRNFRWPVLACVLLATLSVAGFGYWGYREPSNSAATALAEVRAEAETLAGAISQAMPLVGNLDEDRLAEANQDAMVFFEMGERARTMFAASAGLPTSNTADRAAAADAAGLAIDASRQMMDATAYRTALEPALALPLLETDPGLTDLATAAQAFSEWRSGFESVRAGLPTTASTGQAATALNELNVGLEAVQTAYLDALRTNNQPAAVEALGGLRAELQSIRQAMLLDMGEVSASVSALLEQAETKLGQLLR
jgi:hypothetical protein